MTPTNDWHSIIAAESNHLPPGAAQQLRELGFIVMPGPTIQGGCEQLSRAYDRAVATADMAGVHIGRVEETRIWQKIGGQWKHVHFHRSASA